MFVEGKGTYFPEFYRSLFRLLRPVERHDKGVNLIGSISRLRDGGDFERILHESGIGPVRTLKTAETFDDFQQMAASCVNIVIDDSYLDAASDMQKDLGIPFIYHPVSYNLESIGKMYADLSRAVGVRLSWEGARDCCAEAIRKAAAVPHDPFLLDGVGVFRPYECARALHGYGFNVEGLVTMLDEHSNDPCMAECVSYLSSTGASFEFAEYDYKSHMPVMEELAPLEPEFYGFAAPIHLARLVLKGDDYS